MKSFKRFCSNKKLTELKFDQFFNDEGHDRMETSPLICFVNQWSGSYIKRTSIMKELNYLIATTVVYA